MRAAVARGVRSLPDVKLVDIGVMVDDAALRAVRIEVSGRYGADLAATAERVRTQAVAAITEVVGDVVGVEIDIAITDVHR